MTTVFESSQRMKECSTVLKSRMAHFPHHMVNSLHIYLYCSASIDYIQVFKKVNPSQIFNWWIFGQNSHSIPCTPQPCCYKMNEYIRARCFVSPLTLGCISGCHASMSLWTGWWCWKATILSHQPHAAVQWLLRSGWHMRCVCYGCPMTWHDETGLVYAALWLRWRVVKSLWLLDADEIIDFFS